MKTFKILLVLSLVFLFACSDSDDSTNNGDNGGEPSGNERYNSLVFSNVTVDTNVIYGNNTTQGGINQDLIMDVYQPSGDTESSRHLII
ncbi:MAG: hypothetical protein HRT68_16200, partial [Flavobacteriaceae bacterium]|nr:hypothetical protein [Flavobacteriaceae bacterium]